MTSTATAPGPSGTLRRFPALVGYVFRACLPPRRLAVLLLPVAAILGCGLIARTITDVPAEEAFARVAGIGIFGLALPLGALVVGDAVLGAEVRSGTLAFSWLTPTPFAELALARWLGGWFTCLVFLAPAGAVAAVFAGAADHAGPMVIATAAGTAAHVALFVAIGALTRRAAVWSLAFVFLVERLLGAVLSGIAQLSPTWEGRAVYVGLADTPSDLERSGIPHGWAATVRLGLLTAALLVMAVWGLRRLQLAGGRD